MRQLKQSVPTNIMVFMTDSINRVSGKTGLTLSINLSKNGGAFSSITPSVTERGYGWYSIALTSSHTDTLGDLALNITATGADPTDLLCRVVKHTPSGIRKNMSLPAFTFFMTDSVTHTPKTGLTITAQRSLDGGTFGTCTNNATEVGNGVYKIDLSANDLNGDIVTLRFTGTGANDRIIIIVTEP